MPKDGRELINLRMSKNLIRELDAIVKEGGDTFTRCDITRSDVIRILLVAGIRTRAYNQPKTKWWIRCSADDEYMSEDIGECKSEKEYHDAVEKYLLDCSAVKELDKDLPGPYDTQKDAEENLKQFLISEEGYSSGYGRSQFEIFAIDEKGRRIDRYIRNIENIGRSYGIGMSDIFLNEILLPRKGK